MKRYKKTIDALEQQLSKLQSSEQSQKLETLKTEKEQLSEELSKKELAYTSQQLELARLKG
jgi:uncharacterized membrane protein (DUF106 family)